MSQGSRLAIRVGAITLAKLNIDKLPSSLGFGCTPHLNWLQAFGHITVAASKGRVGCPLLDKIRKSKGRNCL